jgi:hypothetical protein
MSKDTPTKEPFRGDSVALAQHASATVARALVKQVYRPSQPTSAIEWDELLRHLVRGPGGDWELGLIRASRSTDSYVQPRVEDVLPKIRIPVLDPTARGKLDRLRNGTTNTSWETYYRGFESDP